MVMGHGDIIKIRGRSLDIGIQLNGTLTLVTQSPDIYSGQHTLHCIISRRINDAVSMLIRIQSLKLFNYLLLLLSYSFHSITHFAQTQ